MKKLLTLCAAVLLSVSMFAAAGLNVYATGMKSTQTDNTLAIEYTLNTQATALYVVFFDANGEQYDAVIISDEALLTEGAHATTITLPEDMEPGTYSWGINAHGNPTTFADVCDNSEEHYSFYLMQDVVVDNSPESPYFGQIYVNMPWAGESDGGCNTTKTQPAGIYVYNSQLVMANYQAAYTGGLTLPAGNRQSIKRMSVGPDGMVYIGGNDVAFNPGVWKMDPSDFTANWTAVLDPATATTDYVKVNALEVVDDKLYTICNVGGDDGGAIKIYDLTVTPYAKRTKTLAVAAEKNLANGDVSIRSDRRGGFWIVQHRYAMDAYSPLQHINAKGQTDFEINSSADDDVKALLNSSLNSHNISYRGALGVSPDGQFLAMGNDKTVKVFQIAYDEAGIPSLTEYCRTATFGSNIDGVAFDYANNLYCASASSERFYVYPLAKGEGENHCLAPAAKQYTITVENAAAEVENLWIIGECATAKWNPSASKQMTKKEPNVFEVEETITDSWFAFTASNSTNWDEVNAARYGSNPSGAAVTPGEAAAITGVGGDYSFTIPAGTYTFTVDLNAMTVMAELKTALDEVSTESMTKIAQDGQIYIIKDGVRYTVLGTEVK